MSQLFSRDELRSLCLALHINPEEMPEGALLAYFAALSDESYGK